MSYYRLYFRDYEGHFCGCRQFEAPDEAPAIVRADRMCSGIAVLLNWFIGAADAHECASADWLFLVWNPVLSERAV